MKLRIVLFLALLIGVGACSQKTCPTYAQDDTSSDVVVEENA